MCKERALEIIGDGEFPGLNQPCGKPGCIAEEDVCISCGDCRRPDALSACSQTKRLQASDTVEFQKHGLPSPWLYGALVARSRETQSRNAGPKGAPGASAPAEGLLRKPFEVSDGVRYPLSPSPFILLSG